MSAQHLCFTSAPHASVRPPSPTHPPPPLNASTTKYTPLQAGFCPYCAVQPAQTTTIVSQRTGKSPRHENMNLVFWQTDPTILNAEQIRLANNPLISYCEKMDQLMTTFKCSCIYCFQVFRFGTPETGVKSCRISRATLYSPKAWQTRAAQAKWKAGEGQEQGRTPKLPGAAPLFVVLSSAQ